MFQWVRIFWENLKTGENGSAGTIYTDNPNEYVRDANERDDGKFYFWEKDDSSERHDGGR